MNRILLALLLFIFVQPSIADSSTSSLTIKKIGTGWGSEGVYIYTNEEEIVEGCTSAGIRINNDHPMLDKILSIALSAYHTKSKVQFRVSGCTGAQMNGIAITVLD